MLIFEQLKCKTPAKTRYMVPNICKKTQKLQTLVSFFKNNKVKCNEFIILPMAATETGLLRVKSEPKEFYQLTYVLFPITPPLGIILNKNSFVCQVTAKQVVNKRERMKLFLRN
jgi:hypothetical protein